MKKPIKVMSVFGTRPEATKMMPLIIALREADGIDSKICVTAQHRHLLDQVLELFHIVPDYDLDLMSHGQTLSDITCRVLTGIAPILEEEKPDILLVHGDTTTTFAASLAAFYQRIAVGHVEAGLRSYDKYQPYPEEINRKLTTQVTDLFFAPTTLSRDNLLKENIPAEKIFVTGNTAIDMIKYTVKPDYQYQNPALNAIDFSKRVILMTAHRRENWGQPMQNIISAAKRIVQDNPDVFLVWPVHPGQAVKPFAYEALGGMDRVLLTEPVDVFDMHNLMSRAHLILSDSGGLQEEAPSFDIPVVVLRSVTERPEGLDAGTLLLAGTEEDIIYAETTRLLTDKAAYQKMAQAQNPYGDGKASARIVDAIKNNLATIEV